MFYMSELADIVKGKLSGDDALASSVSINTRDLLPGQLFLALKGEQFDGHDFLAAACEKQAAGAIVAQAIKLPIPTLQVNNTREALGQLGAYHRSKFTLPIVAVTGSCGKTTTKTMITSILSYMGETLAPEKSFNNEIGVPLTLLQLNQHHRYAVIEMGANHPHEIAYLSGLAQQDIAVITNVAPAHLAGFGTLQGVAQTKGEIYQGLKETGIAVINLDDQFAHYWLQSINGRQVITFAVKSKADVTAKNIRLDSEGRARFEVAYPGGQLQINLPLLGSHNVINALAAIAACHALGASQEALTKGLENVVAVAKRLVKYQGLGGSDIIDDSYNANPLSVSAALEMLAHRQGEKIFVFGDMAELGLQAQAFHEEIGLKAKQLGIDKLLACGEFAQFTVAAFGGQGSHFNNQAGLIDALKSQLHSNAIVLIKGSRSARMENVVQAIIQEN